MHHRHYLATLLLASGGYGLHISDVVFWWLHQRLADVGTAVFNERSHSGVNGPASGRFQLAVLRVVHRRVKCTALITAQPLGSLHLNNSHEKKNLEPSTPLALGCMRHHDPLLARRRVKPEHNCCIAGTKVQIIWDAPEKKKKKRNAHHTKLQDPCGYASRRDKFWHHAGYRCRVGGF